MMRRLYGIRLHVALLTVIPLLLIATVLETYFLREWFVETDRNLLTRGQLIVRQLAASSDYGIFSNNRAFLAAAGSSVLREADVKAVTVLNMAGERLVVAGDADWLGAITPQLLHGGPQVVVGARGLLLAQPVITTPVLLDDGEAVPVPQQVGVALIAISHESTQREKMYLLGRVVSYTATLLLIALVVIYRFSRHLTEPIRALSRAVDAIGAGQLDTRVDVVSHVHEVHGLMGGVNHMAQQLQQERAVLQQRIDEATQQLRELAFYDPLTKLPNRRLLYEHLGHAMAASRRSGRHCALMFIDLDNFKPLNDLHGHDVGDMLLVQAANDLKSCLRGVDTAARLGGDEFVVLLCDLSQQLADATEQALQVAEKIRSVLSEPCCLLIRQESDEPATIEHQCTASIGIALFVDGDASPDEVLQWADSAMYRAKASGRNLIRIHRPERLADTEPADIT